jgi:hypothetical protein
MAKKLKLKIEAYKWREIKPNDPLYAKINESPYFQEKDRKAAEFLKKHPVPKHLLK